MAVQNRAVNGIIKYVFFLNCDSPQPQEVFENTVINVHKNIRMMGRVLCEISCLVTADNIVAFCHNSSNTNTQTNTFSRTTLAQELSGL